MDWPRLGAVLHTTGFWGRSYLGVGRRCCQQNLAESSVKEKTAIALSTWGMPAIEDSEDGGDGRAATGHERGHPRLRQLLMRLRAAPRSEKPIIQPWGFGTGRSVDLQPDTHDCPGKHGRQLWVRCGGGDSPTASSSSEDVSPSPDATIDMLSSDGAPNEMLGAPWDRPPKSPGNWTGRSLREE